MLSKIAFTMLLALGFSGASHGLKPYCDLTAIPTVYEGNLGVLRDDALAVGPDGAVSLVTFENNSFLPVSEITVLIEYFDVSHRPLFTLISHARAGRTGAPPFPFNRVTFSTRLAGPLNPGDSARITGSSPYTSTTCASNAKVVFVHVNYSNGTEMKWANSQWQLGADLADGPQYFGLSTDLISNGDEFLIKARPMSKILPPTPSSSPCPLSVQISRSS
jgi:hypothetical protein